MDPVSCPRLVTSNIEKISISEMYNLIFKLLPALQKNAPEVIIDGYEMVPESDEIVLIKAVANQPVAVAIDAGGKDFQFYSEVTIFRLLSGRDKYEDYNVEIIANHIF